MRKLFAMLASSILLCLATLTGVHASPPIPDRKVHATEMMMCVPTMATCIIDTVATTHAVVLMPALGPVAPASLVAVDGGNEYLALLRSMTCPADRWSGLSNQAGAVSPSRSNQGRQSLKAAAAAGPPLKCDPGR